MRQLEHGINLFNEHRFWEAHEAWEELWLASAGEEKQFLQGLIQLAAAYHHVQRGTLSGGLRLFERSAAKLVHFGDGYLGVRFHAALASAGEQAKRLASGEEIAPAEWPKLRYN